MEVRRQSSIFDAVVSIYGVIEIVPEGPGVLCLVREEQPSFKLASAWVDVLLDVVAVCAWDFFSDFESGNFGAVLEQVDDIYFLFGEAQPYVNFWLIVVFGEGFSQENAIA